VGVGALVEVEVVGVVGVVEDDGVDGGVVLVDEDVVLEVEDVGVPVEVDSVGGEDVGGPGAVVGEEVEVGGPATLELKDVL
jgi:hypothetical protein